MSFGNTEDLIFVPDDESLVNDSALSSSHGDEFSVEGEVDTTWDIIGIVITIVFVLLSLISWKRYSKLITETSSRHASTSDGSRHLLMSPRKLPCAEVPSRSYSEADLRAR
eukprot:Rmarinus@m.14524